MCCVLEHGTLSLGKRGGGGVGHRTFTEAIMVWMSGQEFQNSPY